MTASKLDQPEVTIVGDVMPGRKVADSLRRIGWQDAARRVRSSLKGKLVVGNLECALCDEMSISSTKSDGAPNLIAPTSTAAWLRRAGFTALSLANNHVMDAGTEGLRETLRSLRAAGIETIGAGRNLHEAARPLIADSPDGKIALLAFGNGPPAGLDRPGVAPFNSRVLREALSRLPAEVNLTLVLVHVGIEFLEYPESPLRRFAAEAVCGGADFVIGSHPHCLRGARRLGSSIILYSLGDFLSDTAEPRQLEKHLSRTALTKLNFPPSGADHCRESLAAHLRREAGGTWQCRLSPMMIGKDFLPRSADEAERIAMKKRLRQLSAALKDDHSEKLRSVRQIERAYHRAYHGKRWMPGWLTLPGRLLDRRIGKVSRWRNDQLSMLGNR